MTEWIWGDHAEREREKEITRQWNVSQVFRQRRMTNCHLDALTVDGRRSTVCPRNPSGLTLLEFVRAVGFQDLSASATAAAANPIASVRRRSSLLLRSFHALRLPILVTFNSSRSPSPSVFLHVGRYRPARLLLWKRHVCSALTYVP